jgi:hypothetical protein
MNMEEKLKLKAVSVPVFADEVVVGRVIKAVKEGEEIKKDGYIRIGFIDMTKGQIFSEIVLSPLTAKAMIKILNENLAALEEEMKSKELPKKPLEAKKTEELTYIG